MEWLHRLRSGSIELGMIDEDPLDERPTALESGPAAAGTSDLRRDADPASVATSST